MQLLQENDDDLVQSGPDTSKLGSGRIELRDVEFFYPTRPQARILKGVNMTIEDGQTVALVGGSGCGKSTILHLLQKNYPVSAGSISIDGKNLQDIDSESYRSQMVRF